MPFYKVLPEAGAFLDGFHYTKDEVVEYEPTPEELAKSQMDPPQAILWGQLCDAAGNPLESDESRTGHNTVGQRLARGGTQSTKGKAPAKTDDDKEPTKAAKKAQIKEALSLLEAGNDEHWTSDGLAKVDAVEAVLGYPVAREDIEAASPGFKRPTK